MKNSFAFIVRIWFESREGGGKNAPVYRGMIEPVDADDDGEKKVYFQDIRQLSAYFTAFLSKHGVRSRSPFQFINRLSGKG